MKAIVPYGFNKGAAKKLGRARFLQKHRALLPHSELEKAWDKMFPNAEKDTSDKDTVKPVSEKES